MYQSRQDKIDWRRSDPFGRRPEQRFKSHLSFKLTLPESLTSAHGGSSQTVALTGHTYELGSDTLTLVGPLIRFGYRYLMGKCNALRLVLMLPAGPIQIEGTPTRYAKLEGEQMGTGFIMTGSTEVATDEAEINCLISLRITSMSEMDRTLYNGYLQMLEQEEAEPALLSLGIDGVWRIDSLPSSI